MNAQEIFDTVARFLIKQGKQSMSTMSGRCFYRSPDGLKCAVGCLLSDEDYTPTMENRTVSQLIDGFKLPKFFHENVKLLGRLQTDHDSHGEHIKDFVPYIKNKMKWVAEDYKLSDAVLDEQGVVVPVVDNRFDPSTWGV